MKTRLIEIFIASTARKLGKSEILRSLYNSLKEKEYDVYAVDDLKADLWKTRENIINNNIYKEDKSIIIIYETHELFNSLFTVLPYATILIFITVNEGLLEVLKESYYKYNFKAIVIDYTNIDQIDIERKENFIVIRAPIKQIFSSKLKSTLTKLVADIIIEDLKFYLGC